MAQFFFSVNVLVILSFPLQAQPNAIPFDQKSNVANMLDLLPDEPSYTRILEEFVDGNLVRKSVSESFYNAGNHRQRFEYFREEVHPGKEQTFDRINDSLIIQTSKWYQHDYATIDSLFVFQRNGEIYKSIRKPHNGKLTTTHYHYQDGNLTERIIENDEYGRSRVKSIYQDGKLIRIEFHENDQLNSSINEIQRTDSLITIIAYPPGQREEITSKNLITIDSTGNITRTVAYMRDRRSGEMELLMVTRFRYEGDTIRWADVEPDNPEMATVTKYVFDDLGLIQQVTTSKDKKFVVTTVRK